MSFETRATGSRVEPTLGATPRLVDLHVRQRAQARALDETEHLRILARGPAHAERRSFEGLLIRATEVGRMLPGLPESALARS